MIRIYFFFVSIMLLLPFNLLATDPLDLLSKADKPDVCKIYGGIYITDNPAMADFIIYEEDSEAFANLVVFEEDNQLFADQSGMWYFVPNRGFADFIVYFSERRAYADFTVFFIDTRTFAGCR
ncbi:MAG: DUF6150 family protein [Cyclobacteriaceae bacterium]|nr:hypothetical protein [Cyclobacteriaceae bacterium]MCH8514721.1 DUF6150 family protein [Cyclobacteriaceae bacterium]